ncbi:MAG: hypothetical protein IKU01_04235 [Bacteroidales bacterium]|nr:hypothetical protein [Bacteroidales bacterium]
MKKNKKESFFWTSYSDLMTSMFFVMLVLFVVTVALLHKEMVKIGDEREAMRIERDFTQSQLDKIREIQEATQTIDTNYFKFDENYKRHTLRNITVSFKTGSSDINDIPENVRNTLAKAGESIRKSMLKAQKENPEAKFLLIVEGQSSNDGYVRNYELSYSRALSLVKFWSSRGIYFDKKGGIYNCEVIISGSGTASKFRELPDNSDNEKNQRFVIHIIPKPGEIK